jgi:O-methyltransferase
MSVMLKGIINRVMVNTPYFRHFILKRYDYMFEPDQLIQLCGCIDRVRDVPGLFIEAGCAYGYTTVFLKKYMKRIGLVREYWALDTFSGFVADHVAFEVDERRKSDLFYRDSFALNSKATFQRSLRWQGIEDVRAIECDVSTFEFEPPIAFCLLDIDLYLPIKLALPKIYDALSPGGIIVVDDCSTDDERWDGALQAYQEFVTERNLPTAITGSKLGLVTKP